MSAARSKSSASRNLARDPEYARAERAAKFILSKTKLRPKIALVLGSGLGAFADELTDATRIPYEKIPGFPRSTAIGHAGRLVIGKAGSVVVAAMQGRVHFYEGYSAQEVVFPMRVFGRMGIRAAILTNAAGRHQSGIQAGRAGGDSRSHQFAGHESADWAERRALRSALSGYDDGVLEAVSRDGAGGSEAAWELKFRRACMRRFPDRATKRQRKFVICRRLAPIWWACPRCRK